MPGASIKLTGQAIPKGFAVFLRLAPNHIPSVLLLFISRPEHSRKFDKSLNKFIADFVSETKAVVSSAYWDNLNSLS